MLKIKPVRTDRQTDRQTFYSTYTNVHIHT